MRFVSIEVDLVRDSLARWLECIVVGMQIAVFTIVIPYTWVTAWHDGVFPNLNNDYRFVGLWNHDGPRQTCVDWMFFILSTSVALNIVAAVIARHRRWPLIRVTVFAILWIFVVGIHLPLID